MGVQKGDLLQCTSIEDNKVTFTVNASGDMFTLCMSIADPMGVRLNNGKRMLNVLNGVVMPRIGTPYIVQEVSPMILSGEIVVYHADDNARYLHRVRDAFLVHGVLLQMPQCDMISRMWPALFSSVDSVEGMRCAVDKMLNQLAQELLKVLAPIDLPLVTATLFTILPHEEAATVLDLGVNHALPEDTHFAMDSLGDLHAYIHTVRLMDWLEKNSNEHTA